MDRMAIQESARHAPPILKDGKIPTQERTQEHAKKVTYGWRFWAIFPGLCLVSILTALDSTILSTALPTIVRELQSSSLYVWTINAYTLSLTAVQPVFGQAADIFGRKVAIVAAIALFLLGSGICGGAKSTAMLVGGRAVQGLGGGGLSILPAMIVCDLVPLRERQKYTAFIYAAFAIGTFIGPVVGGSLVDRVGWRWVFWLNLPIASVALLLVLVFLRVQHGRSGPVWRRIGEIDYIGNAVLMAAVTSILIALSGAGTTNSWRSWRTYVPLFLGFMGLLLFMGFEASSWCRQPTMPPRLFANRTSVLAFVLTFFHGVVLYWASYFLPVYFQAVLQASPQQSGIDSLAVAIPLVPFGIIGGVMIAKTGRYKINQVVGFALAAVGIGCLSLLDQKSSTAEWVLLQIILAAGAGIILTATLPAIQAPLPESDVGATTATWGFVQSLGFVWGVAIPSSIFNTEFDKLLPSISDSSVQKVLSGGGAYEHASRVFIASLDNNVQQQVIGVFVASLRRVWQVGSAFAGSGFLAAIFIKEIELRRNLETEYGYDIGEDVQPRAEALD